MDERDSQAIISYIAEDNAEAVAKDGNPIRVGLIYPTQTTDDFIYVLRALVDAICEVGIDCSEPIPIPRTAASGGWAFPRIVGLPEETGHIVAVDQTTRSGATLMELIRLAARPDTKYITCFAVINGLADLAAMGLQQIREVATYSSDDPLSKSQGRVPVSVRYMVRTAITGSDAASCSVCALMETYDSLPPALPQSLSEYRLRLRNVLAPRTRANVFSEQATDLFGVPVTQDDCIAYLTWRSYLEEARFSTNSRKLIVDKISDVVEKLSHISASTIDGSLESDEDHDRDALTRDRDALIRLVAAEHHRLDQAPMWFTSVRAKMLAIARSLLMEPDSRASDPMLRVQALIVLARADIPSFAADYAAIMRKCKDHETVVQHALLEALWLIDYSSDQADWRTSLMEQISMLSNELQAEGTLESTWGDFRPTEELNYLSGLAGQHSQLPPNSQQHAWSELKRFCGSVREHKYDQAMWRLQRRLENVGKGMYPASPSRVLADWEYCSSALVERVFPYLGILRGALTSAEVIERRLPVKDDRLTWQDIVSGGGMKRLNEMSVVVGHAFLGESPEIEHREELARLARVLSRWSQFFFSAPAALEDAKKTPILMQIIDGCPVYLFPTLREIFEASAWSLDFDGVTDDDNIQVFCSATVLIDALTHVRMNAEMTHKQREKTPAFRVEVSNSSDDKLDIKIFNSGSSPSRESGGKGLRRLNASLANFGGRLEGIGELPSGWTFGVKISLERWKWY